MGTDDEIDEKLLKNKLDLILQDINDDYKVERSAALKEVFVETVPTRYFYKWLKIQGKEGGQNKVPRVLKGSQYSSWEDFLEQISEPSPAKHLT